MLQSYIQTSVSTYETNYSRLQFTEIYFVILCLCVMHVVRLGLLRYHLKVTRSITLLTCPIKFNRPELSLNVSPQTEQLEDLQFFCDSISAFSPQAQQVQTEEDAIHSAIAGHAGSLKLATSRRHCTKRVPY